LKWDQHLFWALQAVFAVSLLAGAAVLSYPMEHRPTDGDDAEHFYRAGLTPWSEILSATLWPADPKPFVMQRARPATFLLAPKLYWELAPSNTVYHALIWTFGAASMLAFAWSIVLALSAGGLELHPDAVWILATLCWWTAPMLMYFSLGAVNTWMYALCHLGIAMLCWPGPRRRLRMALSLPVALLAFQSYEGNWYFFVWLGLWLFGTRNASLPAERKPVHYAWPFALLLIFVLAYRSLWPDPKILSAQNPDGFVLSLAPETLLSNAYYYFLVFFNGMSWPLTGPLSNLDTTPAELPLAFLLSVAGFAWAGWDFFKKHARKAASSARVRKTAIAAAACSVAILGAAAPHWTIANHRYIYFPMIPMLFMMVIFTMIAAAGSTLNAVPILLVIAGNALGAYQALDYPNWNDINSGVSTQFYQQAMSRPEFRDCSPQAPCCVTMQSRYWSHNEWNLDWLAGGDPRPSYLPEGWPTSIACARHIRFD
jgi:hypothetical protein